jgi:hypothetical protein
MNRIFSVVVHKEKKYYVAECPEIGTISQGKNFQDYQGMNLLEFLYNLLNDQMTKVNTQYDLSDCFHLIYIYFLL